MRALRRCYAGSEPVAEIAGAVARAPDAVVARRASRHRVAPRSAPVARARGPAPPRRRRGTRAGDRARGTTRTVRRPDPRTHAPTRSRNAYGRSDLGVAARVRQPGLRDGRHRSPHHPAPTDGGLTAGEWLLIDRELAGATGRGLQALSHRLERRHPRARRTTRTRLPIDGAQPRRLKRIAATAGTFARAGSGLRRHAGADHRPANRQRARPHVRVRAVGYLLHRRQARRSHSSNTRSSPRSPPASP
jgi:hypothetical protein